MLLQTKLISQTSSKTWTMHATIEGNFICPLTFSKPGHSLKWQNFKFCCYIIGIINKSESKWNLHEKTYFNWKQYGWPQISNNSVEALMLKYTQGHLNNSIPSTVKKKIFSYHYKAWYVKYKYLNTFSTYLQPL